MRIKSFSQITFPPVLSGTLALWTMTSKSNPMKRKRGSDQERRKRAQRVGLFIAGEDRGICTCFLLQRESMRYRSTPRVEQGNSITTDVRRKGVVRLVLQHLQGAWVPGAGGLVGTGFRAGLARMWRYTADTKRHRQYQCPQGEQQCEFSWQVGLL